MIAQLLGTVVDQDGDMVVISCAGVGYGVRVLLDEQSALQRDRPVCLYIYEHIKEDAHDLYGFVTKTRKQLFERLLSVSGVGPKAALAICNLANEGQVRTAIAAGDTKFIATASGVGKKVAERVVVDLKNKVGLVAADDATAFLRDAAANSGDEAVQALVGLGYSYEDAGLVLRGIDTELSVEERVRLALRAGR
jgi:Holliday junction DNA helicase RuvA